MLLAFSFLCTTRTTEIKYTKTVYSCTIIFIGMYEGQMVLLSYFLRFTIITIQLYFVSPGICSNYSLVCVIYFSIFCTFFGWGMAGTSVHAATCTMYARMLLCVYCGMCDNDEAYQKVRVRELKSMFGNICD